MGLSKPILQHPATPRNRCQRIVAPKDAGSSPVGHPPTFRIGKPNSQKAKESRYKHRGLLTPLWRHSGEVKEVQGRQLGPQRTGMTSAAVSLRGVTELVLAGDVRFQCAFAVYVELHDALGGLLDHCPVTTLALPELIFYLLKCGEAHRGHLDLAPVVGDDRGLSSVGKMMASFRRPYASYGCKSHMQVPALAALSLSGYVRWPRIIFLACFASNGHTLGNPPQ
jgi:hypothetical protein